MLELNKIYNLDCLEGIKQLDDNSIDCVMTSPPYWSLRDYKTEGQLGLESRFEEYISKLITIFDNLKPKLKNTGTLWVNLADTYISSGATRHKGYADYKYQSKGNIDYNEPSGLPQSTRTKSMAGIPFRFATAMINQGWILRNTIIWHKPSCMPQSAKDRFTNDFEYLFFFTKSEKYYFEQQFESFSYSYARDNRPRGIIRQRIYKNSKYNTLLQESTHRAGLNRERGNNIVEKRLNLPNKEIFVQKLKQITDIDSIVRITNFSRTKVEHWFRLDDGFSFPSKEDWQIIQYKLRTTIFPELLDITFATDAIKASSKGRNKRCVWSINPARSYEKHFASYPEKLCETPIRAGCPINGLVLDPFAGTGTTCLVATKLNRNYIGFDLNPEYCQIAEKRLEKYKGQRRLV